MDITEASIIHHVGIVFLVIWLLSSINCCHPFAYFISFIYLYLVHDIYAMRFRRKVQFEEKRQANQKRVLSDSESVRWLNHIVERIWPVCMEEIVSQKVLLPIVPWFLQKYKPWTVKEAEVQNMYLGRSPPMFTEIRVCSQSTDDDHLVMELGMNFRTADDMSALLAVRLTKRLGFGMRTKMHLTGMHVEGKVLVGVKFLPVWPFLGRLRVCFVEPPYFQMTVKPVFAHGLDVTELPGIAGWLDKLLTLVFEETLVEPNMLVVDVEKFVSLKPETWFSVDAKEPVAYVFVEVVEALDMKPSDMNGVADPYVKGQLGAYRFRTKTQKKTTSPKWGEEFKIPITTWDSPNVLDIDVCDKDHFVDDTLGKCNVKINDLRGGQRHDIWLPLQNIKMGRLHLVIKVNEVNGKVTEQPCNENESNEEFKKYTFTTDTADEGASSGELPEKSPQVADNFEPIDVKGQSETGIWVHHPGTKVPQVWAHRKGKNRSPKDSESVCSSADENLEGYRTNPRNAVKRGLRKIGSVFQRIPKAEIDKSSFERRDKDNRGLPLPSPRVNLRAVSAKGISVNLVMEDNLLSPDQSPEDSGPESPNKSKVKNMAKSIMKHAGNSARSVRHVLTRKGSRKGRYRDLSVESDSSCEGSIPDPQGEVSPSFHNSILKHDRKSSSLNSEDVHGLVDSNEVAMDSLDQTRKVSKDICLERPPTNTDANALNKVEVDGSGTSQELPYNSQGTNDKYVEDLESSRPKISE